MRARCSVLLLRLGAMLAAAYALAACTPGGQFDPTTLLDNDMFNNKKPLTGQREPVFPQGVPGATTGIPSDLYKGYQPPPQPAPQQAADVGAARTPVNGPADEPRPKEEPKAKPKPKVARAPPPPRTKITIGLSKKPKPAGEQQPASTDWPAPPSTAQTQPSQTVWPNPPSTAQTQPSQTVWPNPPSTGGGTQQAAQPSQSVWPNPPSTGAQ
jgi:hypothetical protein